MNDTSKLPRFNFLANTLEQALFYYENRVTQMLHQGLSWDGNYKDLGWGISVKLQYKNEDYDSVYVLDRGKGHLTNWFAQKRNYIVADDCDLMASYLVKKNIPHLKLFKNNSPCYRMIDEVYADTRAKRSGKFYMNHIDEGIYILKMMGASDFVIDAFCLHPIVQGDVELKNIGLNGVIEKLGDIDQRTLILMFEYRNIANSYLPQKRNENFDISPLNEVNQMLIADKIQNKKDWQYSFNKGNVRDLGDYFDRWFEKLGVTKSFYTDTVADIYSKTGTPNYSTHL